MKYHRSGIPYVNSVFRYDPVIGCTQPVEYEEKKIVPTNQQLKKLRDEKRALELEIRYEEIK